MCVKWNCEELDVDDRMALHYMVPRVINPIKVAMMDQRCRRAEAKVDRLQHEAMARYVAVAVDTGRKVGGDGAGARIGSGGSERLGIVLEAGRIVRAK